MEYRRFCHKINFSSLCVFVLHCFLLRGLHNSLGGDFSGLVISWLDDFNVLSSSVLSNWLHGIHWSAETFVPHLTTLLLCLPEVVRDGIHRVVLQPFWQNFLALLQLFVALELILPIWHEGIVLILFFHWFVLLLNRVVKCHPTSKILGLLNLLFPSRSRGHSFVVWVKL